MQPTDTQPASASYDAQYEELYGTSGLQSQPPQMEQYPGMSPDQAQPFSQPAGSAYAGGEKKGMSSGMIVLIVVGIVVVVGILITVVLAGVLYMWVISLADTDESYTLMAFDVGDGNNIDDTHGCFFIILASLDVDIDPYDYSFYVSEKGDSPKKLDTTFREYLDSPPYGPDPNSGDLNKTQDWTEDGDLWSDGEYIGFDMPKESMNIDPKDGAIYEVLIKNPNGEVIFRDTFVYSEQYGY